MCEMAVSRNELIELASRVISKARKLEHSIATAESCTGGLISEILTSVPGASDVLEGAVVSYSNRVKSKVLGVSPETLDAYGAVSAQTACEMCVGVRNVLGCDAAVSVTGIAGPSGGVPGKPVGTVWIGASSEKGVEAKLFNFDGDREAVRMQSAYQALRMLEQAL